MPRLKWAEPDRVAFVQQALREHLRRTGSTQAAVAKQAGMTGAALSNIISYGTGLGLGSATGIAKVLGMDLRELEERSKSWADERRAAGLLPAGGDEVRPNYARAVEYAKRKGASASVLSVAERMQRQCPYDLNAQFWVSMIDAVALAEEEARAVGAPLLSVIALRKKRSR